MNHLSEKQVEKITEDLKMKGLTQKHINSEILDHVCCAIEYEMENEKKFEEAYQIVLNSFGEEALQTLQQDIVRAIPRKFSVFKKVTTGFTTAAACLCVFMMFAGDGNAQEKPTIKPVEATCVVSSDFGKRFHPTYKEMRFHTGIDFKAKKGAPVFATADGYVEKIVYNHAGYGNYLIIKHNEEYLTLYSSLDEIDVQQGQEVKQGETIASVGKTPASTGTHLHYEIMKNGEKVNPKDYFKE